MSIVPSPPSWTTIVIAGIVAGSVDVSAAAVINHVSVRIVLQAIAGGLLGKTTFAVGSARMILGLALQWAMSMIIAAVFLAAAQRLPFIAAHPVIAGLFYGPVIYVVMTFVIVPLSRATAKPNLPPVGITAHLAAMMVFGAIVAITPAAMAGVSPIVRR